MRFLGNPFFRNDSEMDLVEKKESGNYYANKYIVDQAVRKLIFQNTCTSYSKCILC